MRIRLRSVFSLLAGIFPALLLAEEPNQEDLPLLEQIRVHGETLQQAGEAPPGPERQAEASPEAADLPLEPVPRVRTDPFRVSHLMQQKVFERRGGPLFTPLHDAPAPDMALKGIVNGGMALLEVQGSGVFLVRAGDTISLSRQGRNTVMKIEKIDRLSLMVKVGTLEEIIVVR
jgi:hypothetical protein